MVLQYLWCHARTAPALLSIVGHRKKTANFRPRPKSRMTFRTALLPSSGRFARQAFLIQSLLGVNNKGAQEALEEAHAGSQGGLFPPLGAWRLRNVRIKMQLQLLQQLLDCWHDFWAEVPHFRRVKRNADLQCKELRLPYPVRLPPAVYRK